MFDVGDDFITGMRKSIINPNFDHQNCRCYRVAMFQQRQLQGLAVGLVVSSTNFVKFVNRYEQEQPMLVVEALKLLRNSTMQFMMHEFL